MVLQAREEAVLLIGDLEGFTVEEVVARYSRIVYKNAARFSGLAETDDLVGEGFFGLMKAIETYDGSVAFKTHAFYRIRFEMMRMLRKTRPGPHTPHGTVSLGVKIRREELERKTAEEIAELLNLPVAHVKRALYYLHISTHSTDAGGGVEGDDDMYGMLGKPDDFTEVLVSAFKDTLDERDRKLLNCLYLEMKQRDIAKVLGCSQMHVSRLTRQLQVKYTDWNGAE